MNSSETAVALGVTPGGHHQLRGHQRQHQPGAARVGTVPVRRGERRRAPEAAQDIAKQGLRHGRHGPRPSARPSSTPRPPPTSASRWSSRRRRASRWPAAPCGRRPPPAPSPVLASLAAVYGFESLMTHRRRRRAEKERVAEQDDAVLRGRPRRGELTAHRDGSRSGRSTQLDAAAPPRRRHETPRWHVDNRVDGASVPSAADDAALDQRPAPTRLAGDLAPEASSLRGRDHDPRDLRRAPVRAAVEAGHQLPAAVAVGGVARRPRTGRAVAVHAADHDARRRQGPQPGPDHAVRLLLRAPRVLRQRGVRVPAGRRARDRRPRDGDGVRPDLRRAWPCATASAVASASTSCCASSWSAARSSPSSASCSSCSTST